MSMQVEKIGYAFNRGNFFPVSVYPVVKVNSIVIHEPDIPHRVRMNIYSIGKVAYDIQKTGFLKNKFVRGIVPTAY